MLRQVIAAEVALIVLASPAWAFGSGAKIWLPDGVTTTTPAIDRLFYVLLWLTCAVFVLVQVVLVAFLIRYRAHPERRAHYSHGNTFIEIVWTATPAVILVALALYSQQVWSVVRGTPPAPDLEIEIVGEQFAWNIRYAGADGELHTADDITTINQMHLPVNKTALLHLTSKDVIHSFFVAQFRMKQDAVPGLISRMWVKPVGEGNFEIACAELCGLGHYRMRGFLVIEPEEAFTVWLSEMLAEQS
jgi:cytochrome c oxidase subunit 2